jgi:hypothetical protein
MLCKLVKFTDISEVLASWNASKQLPNYMAHQPRNTYMTDSPSQVIITTVPQRCQKYLSSAYSLHLFHLLADKGTDTFQKERAVEYNHSIQQNFQICCYTQM